MCIFSLWAQNNKPTSGRVHESYIQIVRAAAHSFIHDFPPTASERLDVGKYAQV